MNLETFLQNFENFDDINFKDNLRLVIQNDNLRDAIRISQFIDINHYEDSYSDFFNVAFNSKCIKIFKFLWKNKRSYDNHDILIENELLSKKSRIGKFYFDQLNLEEKIYGEYIVNCHKGNIYNIGLILCYVKDKDFKKRLCYDGFYICRTSHPNFQCAKYILEQNRKAIIKNVKLFNLINYEKELKRNFINYKRSVYKKDV